MLVRPPEEPQGISEAKEIFARVAVAARKAKAWLEANLLGARQDPPAPVSPELSDTTRALSEAVLFEVENARGWFPGANANALAWTEEAGELAEAILSGDPERVRAEAVQVAAMCLRLVTEGDPTLGLPPAEVGRKAVAMFPRLPPGVRVEPGGYGKENRTAPSLLVRGWDWRELLALARYERAQAGVTTRPAYPPGFATPEDPPVTGKDRLCADRAADLFPMDFTVSECVRLAALLDGVGIVLSPAQVLSLSDLASGARKASRDIGGEDGALLWRFAAHAQELVVTGTAVAARAIQTLASLQGSTLHNPAADAPEASGDNS